jgi:hypothetical protein
MAEVGVGTSRREAAAVKASLNVSEFVVVLRPSTYLKEVIFCELIVVSRDRA